MRASERAYIALRDAILDGTFAPGFVLGEVEQSGRLGVSRTPVREALRRLVAEGLVTERSRRVLVVSGLDAERIRNLYELREALESRAAALAARRRDPAVFRDLRSRFERVPGLLDEGGSGVEASFALIDELDRAIDDAVDNDDFRHALASARLHSARIRRLSRQNPERLHTAAVEHLLVIDAILEGDTELAAHATHVHLSNSLRNALETNETNESTESLDPDTRVSA